MPLLREPLCHYRYDALDRLIGHAQQDAQQHRRFYCKSRLATEIQGALQHSIVQHDDWLLAQQRSEGDALDTTLLATDQQRSVLHTLKANHQCQPIAYSPYGHRHPENGLLSLLGFNGERPDPVTGHYLLGNGYRGFNPVLMRFNGPDSVSPFGEGGLNTYAYCQGDPVNQNDPTGHRSIWLLGLERQTVRARYPRRPLPNAMNGLMDQPTPTPQPAARTETPLIPTQPRTNGWVPARRFTTAPVISENTVVITETISNDQFAPAATDMAFRERLQNRRMSPVNVEVPNFFQNLTPSPTQRSVQAAPTTSHGSTEALNVDRLRRGT